MREKTLAIIGQGYVGLPLAMAAVDAGWSVVGIEKSVSRVDQLNSGSSPVEDISDTRLAKALAGKKYIASNNPGDVSTASVVTICVPTPLNRQREPDLELLESATKDVAPFLGDGTLLVSESTSYPGTLREIIITLVIRLKSSETKTLYFASRGHVGMGGSDLFVSRMDKNGNWSKAVNLGYPINTLFDENSLMVSAKGDIAFLASNRPGGYGDLDIYYFKLPDEIKPTKTFYFDGLVFDLKTRKALAGHFQLIDIESRQVVIISDADKIDGSFMVALPINRDYAISVSYPGYFPYSLNFNLSIPDGQENYHLDIPLNPETSEVENVLSNVFFDVNQSKIRETSKIELLEFVAYLKENPQHKIELGGHTDSRGNRTDNLILSSERAKSVFDFLISNGINANRLSYKGYGSTQTIISDVEIEKMNSEQEKEKAHQKNRRTVYKIIL